MKNIKGRSIVASMIAMSGVDFNDYRARLPVLSTKPVFSDEEKNKLIGLSGKAKKDYVKELKAKRKNV